jgi:rubrerythrin
MVSLPAGYPEQAFDAFAFLTTRKELSVEDMQVLAMIECFGEAFYLLLADNVSNAEAKTLLTRNGNEERGHAHRLLKAIKLKSGTEFALPANEDNPFFKFCPTELKCDDDLIAALEKGEAEGDLVYQVWADAENNPQVADLLRLNGREETRHGERVSEVKKLLAA